MFNKTWFMDVGGLECLVGVALLLWFERRLFGVDRWLFGDLQNVVSACELVNWKRTL